MNEEQEEDPQCAECRRELYLGLDALRLQQGVVGPRGFIVLDKPTFFCDETCLARYLNDEPAEEGSLADL